LLGSSLTFQTWIQKNRKAAKIAPLPNFALSLIALHGLSAKSKFLAVQPDARLASLAAT
jgi:hypothetical protein